MWVWISAVCDWNCRNWRPSWSKTTLPSVWDVKKLPVRPKLPDLRPSLSRITLALRVGLDLRCMWLKLPDWRPSWSKNNLAFSVGCEEAPCPAITSGFKAVVVKNNLALRVGLDLRCMWPKLPDWRPSWSEQPCLLCGMWRSSLSGPNLPDLRASRSWRSLLSWGAYLPEISGSKAIVIKKLAFREGEEGLSPAKISGSKAVVAKNSLDFCMGWEEGHDPVKASRSKAVVVGTALPFMWVRISLYLTAIAGSKAVVVGTALPPLRDVKKLPVRPKLPALRPWRLKICQNRKRNLRFFTGAYLDAHPQTFKYIPINKLLLIKMYWF